MSGVDEQLLEERVNRYYGPLRLMIWDGFLFLLAVVLLVAGAIMGTISAGLAVILGIITLMLVTAHGIVFSNTMIREDLREKEREKMIKEGLIEKDKRERLALSDDGELIDYQQHQAQTHAQAHN